MRLGKISPEEHVISHQSDCFALIHLPTFQKLLRCQITECNSADDDINDKLD